MADSTAGDKPVFRKPIFDKLCLIGIGLIGASIAIRARRDGLVDHIAVSTRSADTLARAQGLGLGDSYTTDPAEAVKDADCVILCTPVGVMGAVAQRIAPNLKPGCILSDAGSVKRSVINQMAPHVPDDVHFVPGHPIAGTEDSGPEAGFATLFDRRWQILTPLPGTDGQAVERLSAFWQALGSDVEIMDPDHHDRVLAVTSHIPHLIAYNIVGTASDMEEVTEKEVIKFSASGFRDFTRIAASDPVMWRDVFLHNRTAVLEVLGRFSEDLAALQKAVRWGNGALLEEHFTKTRAVRRSILDSGQDVAAPNFGRDLAAVPMEEPAAESDQES